MRMLCWLVSTQDHALHGRSQTSPENNMRTYQCLHDSIRRCSPIGTLQALRINGTITPTVEKDMLISLMTPFVSFTTTRSR